MKTDLTNILLLAIIGGGCGSTAFQRFTDGDVWIGLAGVAVVLVCVACIAGLLRDLCRKRPR